MMYRQKWRFLAEQKARYVLLPIFGLFVFMQLVNHDGVIYGAIERGEADSSALEERYFPQWTFEDGVMIIRATLAAIAALVVYAVLIRAAQKRVEKVGYSI